MRFYLNSHKFQEDCFIFCKYRQSCDFLMQFSDTPTPAPLSNGWLINNHSVVSIGHRVKLEFSSSPGSLIHEFWICQTFKRSFVIFCGNLLSGRLTNVGKGDKNLSARKCLWPVIGKIVGYQSGFLIVQHNCLLKGRPLAKHVVMRSNAGTGCLKTVSR